MPRQRLSRGDVVRAAAHLADEQGWDGLSLSAVALRVGVRQPSLYKHVASLAALRQSVSALAVTELGEALKSAAVGMAGTDALLAIAAAYRQYAHEHPGRYAASVTAPTGEDPDHTRAAEDILRTLAAVLGAYGLDDAAEHAGSPLAAPAEAPTPTSASGTLHAIRALRAMLHGFVAIEAAGGFAMDLDLDESFRRMITGFEATLR